MPAESRPFLLFAILLCLAGLSGCMARGRAQLYRVNPCSAQDSPSASDNADPRGILPPDGEPAHRLAPEATAAGLDTKFAAASALLNDLKYDEAARAFGALAAEAESAGHAQIAAESLFLLGFSHGKAGRPNEARAAFQKVQKVYPESRAASLARAREQSL